MNNVEPPSFWKAMESESVFGGFGTLSIQPKWDIPETIGIHVAASARMALRDEDLQAHGAEATGGGYPATIDEYITATTEVIDAGACGIHIDYGGVKDKDGRRLDEEMPSVEAYGKILAPLRERFGADFVSDVNVFAGATFEECLAPAAAGLGETSPLAAGGPEEFKIPAAERLGELGLRPGIGVHHTGEIELARRRFIEPEVIKPPYHWWILYGMPFETGSTLRSGISLRNVQDAAQHLFLMVDQIKSLDPESVIVVCAAGRATPDLTTRATRPPPRPPT